MKYVAAKTCKIRISGADCLRNGRDSQPKRRIELTKPRRIVCPTHRGGNPNAASSCSGSRLLLPRLAMLRLRDPQDSLWDQLLPPQARTLSAELTAVDACLADDRHRSLASIASIVQVADRPWPVEVRAAAGGRGIGAALEIHGAPVDHVRKQDIPRSLA